MYHDVYGTSPDESGFVRASMQQYKISRDVFEKHISAIRDYISVNEKTNITITFDDGGVSFITIIAPLLEKYGLSGIFFISTKYLNSPGFLTSEQVKDLEERGHVIGSHSFSHPDNLLKLDINELLSEWQDSLKELKRILGHQVTIVSIPNGFFNKKVIRTLRECGVDTVYTSEPTTKTDLRLGQRIYGRYVIQEGMTPEDVMKIVTSKKERLYLILRWNLLGLIKGILGKHYNSIKLLIIRKR